jgi:hypothetical protein
MFDEKVFAGDRKVGAAATNVPNLLTTHKSLESPANNGVYF